MGQTQIVIGQAAALEVELASAVGAAQAADPLAPVTILVGGTLLRPYLRRCLADLLDGGHANLRIITPSELGLLLGEKALLGSGREPLPFLADRVLAQQVVHDAEAYFEPVADMPGFGTALHQTIRELRQAGISPDDLGGAASADGVNQPKLRELAREFASYEHHRSAFYMSDDGLADIDPSLLDGDCLLVYGLWRPWALLKQAIARIAEHVPVTYFLPETGTRADHALDDVTTWLERDLGAYITRLEDDDNTGDKPEIQLVSAPDAGREIDDAVRMVLRWADEGLGFHEVAITYRHANPYRSLIEAALRDANIPVYLHEGTPLSERPVGRRVLALLNLVDSPLGRGAVMEFLTDARLPNEVWEKYGRVSVARWDSISREAGILEGIDQWRTRLDVFVENFAARFDDDRDPPAWAQERMASAENLRRFVIHLDAALNGRSERASFRDHVAYIRGLFTRYIADAEPVLDALEGLERLDSLGSEISFERFRDVVIHFVESLRASDVTDSRAGSFGLRGVQVVDANTMRHLSFRGVIAVGLSERAWPPPPRQDALLLDRERQLLNDRLGWELSLRAFGADSEPLQFAMVMQAARERLQLSFPRADSEAARPLLPSSFFRGVAETELGRPISAEEVDDLPGPLFRRIRASHLGAPDPASALTAAEYQRTLIETDRKLGVGLLARRRPTYARAKAAEDARWTRRLTPYDGVFGDEGREALADFWVIKRPWSPSSVERYSTCPYQFFLESILRVKAVDEPESIPRISALDKGSLFHKIVELFMRERVGDPPSAARRTEQLARLKAIAEEQFREVEQRGVTGYDVLWAMDRDAMLDDLEIWFDHEASDPRTRELPNAAFEVRFGPAYGNESAEPPSMDEPLAVPAGDGELLFNGRIDRLEWRESPPEFRVIDYKTGSKYGSDGALGGGTALQLPIYIRAAARALGMDPSQGGAEYFYATRKGGFERVEFSREDFADRAEDLEALLAQIGNAIRAGDFHAEPEYHCNWCRVEPICDARRDRIHRTKADDPRAVAFAERKKVR